MKQQKLSRLFVIAIAMAFLLVGGIPDATNAQSVMCQGRVATIVGTNNNDVLIARPMMMSFMAWRSRYY